MTDDPALLAYEAMAPAYDEFNGQNHYGDIWFPALLPKLEQLGLRQGSLLDVACGTGRAIGPMLERGWTITACDISPAMVHRAALKYPEGVTFDVRDMRRLARYSAEGFQLVWALNDAINYLTGDDDLERALGSMAMNLADDGLLVFDTSTERLLREAFGESEGLQRGESWTWQGLGRRDGIWEAELSGAGIEPHRHRQRHWSVGDVGAAAESAGLEHLAAMGQLDEPEGLVITDDWDEARDHKIMHVLRR